MILMIVFIVVTVLLILAALGANYGPETARPFYRSGSFVLIVIDLCILGWNIFGGK